MSRRRIYWICQIVGWFSYPVAYLIAMMVAPRTYRSEVSR